MNLTRSTVKGIMHCLAGWLLLGPGAVPAGAEPTMWSAGSERGVYLLKATVDEQGGQGFRIYYRPRLGDRFRIGRSYQGAPQLVTTRNDRLEVVFAGGVMLSYDLYEYRTGRRVPAGLDALALAAEGDRLYVLVRAAEAGPLDVPNYALPPADVDTTTEPAPQTPPGEPSDPDLPAAPPTVEAGQLLLLVRSLERPWQVWIEDLSDLQGCEGYSMTMIDGVAHLWARRAADQLVHVAVTPTKAERSPPLTIAGLRGVTALAVNRQLCAVVAVAPEGSDGCTYRLLTDPTAGDAGTAPVLLKADGQTLVLAPQRLSLAAMEQNLVVFQRLEDDTVVYGLAPLEAKPRLTFAPVQAPLDSGAGRFWTWLYGPTALALMMVVMALLLYWRRNEAFLATRPLPAHVLLAPLGRRLIAFVLDAFPAFFLMVLLVPDLADRLPEQQALLEQMPTGGPAPVLVFKAYGIFVVILTAYLTLCEAVLAGTPGKRAMQLVVLDVKGDPPRRAQLVLRNVLRIIELHFHLYPIILLVLVFSRRRQRIGDLVARTIVAVNTPALRARLFELVQARLRGQVPPPPDDEPSTPDA